MNRNRAILLGVMAAVLIGSCYIGTEMHHVEMRIGTTQQIGSSSPMTPGKTMTIIMTTSGPMVESEYRKACINTPGFRELNQRYFGRTLEEYQRESNSFRPK